MKFSKCKIKSIRADIANGELTVSFGLLVSSETLKLAAQLANYADKDAGHVDVEIIPQQLPLLPEAHEKSNS